ncbi:MAG: hypothetical protein JXA14_02795 [Anaerolineae bacterium]|nr:hypothetical protein [Anaerolineae bacterium]
MMRRCILILFLVLVSACCGTHEAPLPPAVVVPTSVPTATPAPTATPLPPTATPIGLTPDARNVELVGHIGGVTRAVFAQGDYLYAGFGPELAVLDISNPVQPERVGYTIMPHMMWWISDLYVVGQYAYAVCTEGLWVVDVGNPSAPVVVGFYEMQSESPYAIGVVVAEDYAYIFGVSSIQVIDVSDPTNPAKVGLFDTLSRVYDVAVADGYAYVVEEKGLLVADISDPTMPTEVGFFDPFSVVPAEEELGFPELVGVAVVDGYAYVAGTHLWVVDISNPADPAGVGFYDLDVVDCSRGLRMGILIAGDYVYLTEYPGLVVIDVSDPSQPVEVAAYENSLLSHGMAMVEGYIYVGMFSSGACRDLAYLGGLQIIDVSDQSRPIWAGAYAAPAVAVTVKVAGDYALVAAETDGLRIMDVSDPADPIEVGSYGESVVDVAVTDDYAFVADCWCTHLGSCGGGIHVVDISNPGIPVEVEARGGWCVSHIKTVGDYVYFNAMTDYYDRWLQVVDVSDPAGPVLVGRHDILGHSILDVAVAEDYAYISGRGLSVLDVSDPADPVEVGFCEGPSRALALADSYLYVAGGEAGLRVLDLSDPTAPVEVSSCDTPGEAVGVAAADGYAFVADREGGCG